MFNVHHKKNQIIKFLLDDFKTLNALSRMLLTVREKLLIMGIFNLN